MLGIETTSKTVKVKVITEFINSTLKEILPFDYVTELTIKNVNNNYSGFSFIGANGHTYNDKTIRDIAGHRKLETIFQKI